MGQNGKYKYLAKNTLLFTISSMSSKLLVFFLVPLYTSVLSTADYGTADLITTTSNLLFFVFTLNISDAVLRFAIDDIETGKSCLNYGLRILLYGSILFICGSIIAWQFKLVGWADYCYLFLFLYFSCHALYQMLNNFLRAADRVADVAISGIISTAVMIGLNILLLLVVKLGIVGYLISLVAGQLAAALYCLFIIMRHYSDFIKAKCSNELKKQMRKYSIPLIFNGIAWWMNSSIDKYFVTGMLGTGANGIYAVSYKIPTILTVFQNIFSQAWNLSAIKEFDKNDKEGFFAKTYSFYNAALVMACSALILINIPLAHILYSKDFFVAWKYSSVLLISIVFSALGGFVGSVFSAVKNSRVYAVSTVISAITNIILNAILIPKFEIMGAAIATDISFVMIWAIRVICARKYIKWKINWLKDCIAYLLLVAQIIAEQLSNHGYAWQAISFILIIVIYHKQFIDVLKLLTGKLKRKRRSV